MPQPDKLTVSVDLPAAADADLLGKFALHAADVFSLALFCAIVAGASATVLSRSPRAAMRRVVFLSSSISMAVPIAILVAIGLISGAFQQQDRLYFIVSLIPAAVVLCIVALFVSAPMAWVVSRRCLKGANSKIFE